MLFIDYYSILLVSPCATQDQIKKAYRDLARRFHPDINNSGDANEKMQEINEAYLVLSDVETRKLYDREFLKFHAWMTRDPQYKDRAEYKFSDEELKERVEKASEKARSLGRQVLHDSKELLSVAGATAAKELVFWGIVALVFFIIFLVLAT